MANVHPNRVYEDHDPPTQSVSDEGCDTILVYLAGFTKEQLKVQLTTSGVLRISGERLTDKKKGKWLRFQKELTITPNYDTKNIKAKFEGGILRIELPILITETPPQPQPQPQTYAEEEPQTTRATGIPDQVPMPMPMSMATPKPKPAVQPFEPRPHLEERKGLSGSAPDQRLKQGERRSDSDLFKELRKPRNFKRLVVSVLMVLIVGFYILQTLKSFTGKDQKQKLLKFDQEL